MIRLRESVLAALLMINLALPSVLARGNDLTITDGMGEQLQVKHSLFGKKTRIVKDRLGDGFAQEQSLLGSRTTEIGLLGSQFKSKTGLLGNSETGASTIFGDKFVSKKGIFGRRKTAVDLSGSSQLIRGLLSKPKPILLNSPGNNLTPTAPSQ